MNNKFIDYLRKLPKDKRPEVACSQAPCIYQDVECTSCPLQPLRMSSYVEKRREYLATYDAKATPQ